MTGIRHAVLWRWLSWIDPQSVMTLCSDSEVLNSVKMNYASLSHYLSPGNRRGSVEICRTRNWFRDWFEAASIHSACSTISVSSPCKLFKRQIKQVIWYTWLQTGIKIFQLQFMRVAWIHTWWEFKNRQFEGTFCPHPPHQKQRWHLRRSQIPSIVSWVFKH